MNHPINKIIITEVEIYAYAAGLKDGMRFALELTV